MRRYILLFLVVICMTLFAAGQRTDAQAQAGGETHKTEETAGAGNKPQVAGETDKERERADGQTSESVGKAAGSKEQGAKSERADTQVRGNGGTPGEKTVAGRKAQGAQTTEEKVKAEAKHQAVQVAMPGPGYIIGPGDVLDISLWRDDALTRQVVVLPDNMISFPLIGEVVAGGRTIGELKQDIIEKLTPYVPEPVLSVEVKQVNSMLIYVIGRVNAPGRFILNTNINVLQALAMAGGLNPFAKREKIRIFRQEGDTKKTFLFNYDDVSEGKKLDQNITLKRGDVIVVP